MRRVWIALLGGSVLLVGVIMVVLPGPAILIIPVGLGILATEFAWARRYFSRCRKACDRVGLPRKPRAWLRWLATRKRPPAAAPAPASLPRWLP